MEQLDEIPEQIEGYQEIPELDVLLNKSDKNNNENMTETIEPSLFNSANKEILAETIEIPKQNIIMYLKPQISKYWRFTFKNEVNIYRLKKIIETVSNYGLTVDFGEAQNTPDITISQGELIVGKINLLLSDRRDANLPEKYYCKLYFYYFKNKELYQSVKSAVVNYFMNFKQLPRKKIEGTSNKTNRRKRNMRRKKTLKRKINSK